MKRHELHRYLAHAELGGQISEFCALYLQALLAMAEDSDFAIDYLEMAEAIAPSTHQQAIVADTRVAHDWLHTNSAGATRNMQTFFVHDCQAVELWDNLISALRGVGQTETNTCCKLVHSIAA